MNASKGLSFRDRAIEIDGRSWTVEYPIVDARRLGNDSVVVLYDDSAGPRYHFANLEAFDLDGNKIWTAEQPTTESAEAYIQIAGTDPLVAQSFTAFRCTLDEATGRIIKREFTK